jgi:hypothetical protein
MCVEQLGRQHVPWGGPHHVNEEDGLIGEGEELHKGDAAVPEGLDQGATLQADTASHVVTIWLLELPHRGLRG